LELANAKMREALCAGKRIVLVAEVDAFSAKRERTNPSNLRLPVESAAKLE